MGKVEALPGVCSCAHCRYSADAGSYDRLLLCLLIKGERWDARHMRLHGGLCGPNGAYFEREPGAES